MRGKVTGISQELVELIERGGAHCTYRTTDFLALSPKNLSRNFRLKETIGISYDLQRIWLGDTVHPVNLARGRSREYRCPPSRPAVNAGSLAAVSQPRVPMLPQYGGILKNRRVGLQPRRCSQVVLFRLHRYLPQQQA